MKEREWESMGTLSSAGWIRQGYKEKGIVKTNRAGSIIPFVNFFLQQSGNYFLTYLNP